MKAILKTQKGVGNVILYEVPVPEFSEDEVLIKVHAVGLCGSDVHILHDLIPYNTPVIIGHEFCGEIVAIGDKVKNFAVGDKVIAENIVEGCGTCELCRSGHQCICPQRNAKGINSDGGMAEYVVCRENRLYHLPDHMSYEEGALMEPLTVCCHAVLEQNHISAGDVVLVTGPGSIGLIVATLVKASGAHVILVGIDADEERLKKAEELGISSSLQLGKDNVKEIVAKLTDGQGVDIAFECSGSGQALEMALYLLKFRGKLTQIGLYSKATTVNMNLIVSKEIQIIGALSHTNYAWKHAIRVMQEGLIDLKAMITHQYSLTEWEKAFKIFEEKKGIKIILKP